jgi:hypothetical protein
VTHASWKCRAILIASKKHRPAYIMLKRQVISDNHTSCLLAMAESL